MIFFAITGTAQAAVSFGPAGSIDVGGGPAIATDDAGLWIVPVVSAAGLAILRSTDNGATWTSAFATEGGGVNRVATDRLGTWVVAWHSTTSLAGTTGSDADLFFIRSTDNGLTWSAPAPLNTNAATDDGEDDFVELAADGIGNFVAVWNSRDSLGGTIGTDNDILFSRSSDGGATWIPPSPLTTTFTVDGATIQDLTPHVTTDRAGTWLVVWETTNPTTKNRDIAYVRSTDAGATWGTPALINTNMDEPGGNFRPKVATDGQGNWVTTWIHDTPVGGRGFLGDIVTAHSSDNGLSWSDTVRLHPHFDIDRGDDEWVHVATDRRGTWVAAWHSNDALGARVGRDFDILYSRSLDNGASWTAPAALNTNAGRGIDEPFAGSTDRFPRLAADSNGNWLAVWESNDTLDGMLDGTQHALVAVSQRNCPTMAATGCRQPVAAGKSRLAMKSPKRGGHGSLGWKWAAGQASSLSDFADPTAGSDYVFCLYDSASGTPFLIFEQDLPAGALCGGAPCWEARSDGFRYRDKDLLLGPVARLVLRAGAEGKAKIGLKANGPSLAVPVLPLKQDTAVTAQLLNRGNGMCWEATYSTALKNRSRRFKARSD